MNNKVFVTGGAGYIGTHACVELLKRDYEVMVYDNLSNGSEDALKTVSLLANKNLEFRKGDICDLNLLTKVMREFRPGVTLHFAGLKAVSESVITPISYYDVNVVGTLNLLKAMSVSECHNIIFSSSATVYDPRQKPPFREDAETNPGSPYGNTKLAVEKLLQDWAQSGDTNKAISLRYFNPIGAHPSGKIGEAPVHTPNNLMPIISRVASGEMQELFVYGDDYLTRDGTGERDFIHVVDLAIGHLKAIEKINTLAKFDVVNLGTGKGTTVKELITIFEKVNNVKIHRRIMKRRAGDVSVSVADPAKSSQVLEFQCSKTIEDMCVDAWRWEKKCG